jgi:hypothetical protein
MHTHITTTPMGADPAARSTDVTNSDLDLEASARRSAVAEAAEAASECAAATFARRSLFF